MSKSIDETLRRLAATESALVGGEFLAPVVRGHGVVVKIAGVRCKLSVSPNDFDGWGLFRAESPAHAALVRQASATERQRYLRLFPTVRFIACGIEGATIEAMPAHLGDQRFDFAGPVEVRLGDRVELFDVLTARFDGAWFWFEQVDPRGDPGAAAYLRRELVRLAEPKDLDRRGLTREERLAYALRYDRRTASILADRRGREEAKLTAALAHAGAELSDFTDGADAYGITYTVDGRRHTSVVRKGDLTVSSAGICLSGQDRDFDLSSLVGVLREAAGAGRFVRY